MIRTLRLSIASLALAASGAAHATLIDNLGTLGPSGTQTFSHSFSSPGDFSDEYQFTLLSSANAFGGILILDSVLNKFDINVECLSLWRDGVFLDASSPATGFEFSGLSDGTYSLLVRGTVSRVFGRLDQDVAYRLQIATLTTPTSVPEPSTLVLFGASLIGLGAMRRRRAG